METFHHLYFLQDEILSALSEFAKKNDFPFVLTGGTALVRFLLKSSYRVSYDLDFFSDRLNVFESWNYESLIEFLKGRFPVVLAKMSKEGTQMLFVEVGSKNSIVRIDFVEDVFSGIFDSEEFSLTPLRIEPINAIYFRKIYTVVTSSLIRPEKLIERVKDIVDLIYLDQKVKPFSGYLLEEFLQIAQANFGTISHSRLLTIIDNVHNLVLDNAEFVNYILINTLYSKVSIEEVLKWLEEQKETISSILKGDL